MKKVAVIGGGTGSFVVLSGLKNYPVNLSAIVTMMDSGGSTGRLRDQLGVLPPGDFRQGLVALSEASLLWRRLFLYRFSHGDLAGHNFGNIFISALEKTTKNYQEVVEIANYILQTKGRVIPVTFDSVNLVAEYSNKKILKGEGKIDSFRDKEVKIEKIYLEPPALPNKEAIKIIKNSHYIIIGPGDLYTSLIPVLLVKKIKEVFLETKAKLIYIVNLMTKLGQTNNFKASDHLRVIESYLGRKVDLVLINNGRIPDKVIKWYKKYHEEVVIDDLGKDRTRKIIRADLISRNFYQQQKGDHLIRSILRHSPKKLAKLIFSII